MKSRLTSAPPRLSITSNTRTLTLPFAYSVTANSDRKDITFFDVFTFGPNTGIPFQFRECYISGVKVYWQSDNSTSDAGSVCLTVEDYGENEGTVTLEIPEVLSFPGTMVRKVWQNVSNRWFPTEPSEREFHNLLDKIGVLTVSVRHTIPEGKLKGRVMCVVTARVRGRSIKRCEAYKQLLIEESLDTTFEKLDMAASPPV
jgi:hypothetical protein